MNTTATTEMAVTAMKAAHLLMRVFFGKLLAEIIFRVGRV